MQTTFDGRVVAAVARDYDPWTDSRGNARPGGTTYRLWLSEDFTTAPVDVRCSEVMYREALGLGAGAQVKVTVEIQAKDNKLAYSLVSLRPAGEVAQLANGRKSA